MLIKRIPDGPAGIAETVTAILAVAHDPNTTNQIRDIALWICKRAGAKTEMEKAQAIFKWMRKNVTYVKDPIYREFVQPPLFLLKQGMKRSHKAAGDCDDHTACNMALLGALGFSTRAVISEDPTRPGPGNLPMWAHIYCEVEARKHPKGKRFWTPVDSSMWFLKFGEKVGGRQTTVYPGDIHPDIYFEASRNRRGLGYVSKTIDLASDSVDQAMKRRISKPGIFNFDFTVNGLDGANGLGGWGLLTPVISAGSSITQALIGKRLQEKLAKRQGQLEQAKLNAQVRLAEQAQKLEFQAQQLNAERAALIQSEEAAFDRLRSASRKDRITAAALVGVPLVGIFVLNFIRKKREK